jgi:hypothetical protein
MTTHQPSGPLAPVDPQPVLGLHGEPCASCGAPLAADQRYCLDCGARRADARLPFRDILAAAPAPLAAHGPAGAPAQQPPARHESNRSGTLAALAGLGVVLLALAAGVLIGQAGDDGSKQSTTPQVINLGGTATTPGAAAAAGAAAGKAAASSSKSSSSKSKSSSSGASSSSSKASNPNIKNLEKLSPQQYQKQSQKLPKVVGTGGKPPPKDNKPAAGGGQFQSIG